VTGTGTHAGAAEPAVRLAEAHDCFRALMLGGGHPCLGGSAAVRRGHYRLGLYPRLSSTEAVRDCARDLREFLTRGSETDCPVSVHVAVFDGPHGMTEPQFEQALWEQLRGMRATEVRRRGRASSGRPDLDGDPGFVFEGRNLFVVGLHPGASRRARRFDWPTLVFNALSHADPLQAAGQYDRLTQKIRARDLRLQGSPNPSMFQPRVAQFSGRAVNDGWTCPVELDR
jgi:FPC/CPF motif-containing protein YcgG